MTKVNVVIVKGPTTEDTAKVGAVVITPGFLLELETDGEVIPHAAIGGNQFRMFAKNRDFLGKEISEIIPVGDTLQVINAQPGAVINAILEDVQTIVIGDLLESAGDGTLRKHVPIASTGANSFTVLPLSIVGTATEAVTTAGATARIAVRIV